MGETRVTWLDRLTGRTARRDAPETKDSRAGPLIAFSAGGRPRWTPRDYASLAAEGFGKNAVVDVYPIILEHLEKTALG